MGLFMQIYNLKVDDKTHKNDATVDTQVFSGDQSIRHMVQTSEQLKQTGEQLTLQEAVSLSSLEPGKYRVEIKTTDAIANQTITRSTEFTIIPGENSNTAAQARP
jgi:hypothetical protein